MGATIIVGMKAAACRRPNGQVTYFLFENTYEKNCYPHDPHWSCVAIGTYDQVLYRVFQSAAACEGGSLQGRGRYLRPENFIRRWQRELRAPVTMPDVSIRVRPTLPYALEGEHGKYLDKVCAVFAAHGRQDLADVFRSVQDVTLALHADVDLVVALHGMGGPVSPWRAVTIDQTFCTAAEALAPPAAAESLIVPTSKVWALDADVRVGKVGSQPLQVLGWEYRAVGDYLREHVYPLELRRMGISGDLIRRFRQACRSALPLPDATRMTIRLGDIPDAHPWQRACAARIAAALDIAHAPTFTVPLGDIRSADTVRDLQSLSVGQLTWDEASITEASAVSEALALQAC
ncbi:hypothetical protein ACI2UN_08710 [Ralstonia nicotianae]